MTKASDNVFPKLLVLEGSAPSSPSAGDQALYIDSSDHKLKRKNSSGTVTAIEDVAAAFVGCRASRTATQSMTSGTELAVALTATDDYDTNGFHFTSTANLTGTVTKSSGSTTVTGSSSAFDTELTVNQIVDIPGGGANDRVVVTAIASATSMTVAVAPTHSASGQTATRVASALAIPASYGGKYRVTMYLQIQNSTAGTFRLIRTYHGIQSTGAGAQPTDGDMQLPFHANVATNGAKTYDYAFTAGDWIEMRGYQDSGGALNAQAAVVSLQYLGA